MFVISEKGSKMQLTSAQNVQNRGSFQASQTALKSGGSSPDRQSGGETYMPYQQGDQFVYRPAPTVQLHTPVQASGLALWIERLLNLDIRVYTSFIATLIFSTLFQAATESSIIVTVLLAVPFFLVWYVMSFFNFQRVCQNAFAPQQNINRRSYQVPATF